MNANSIYRDSILLMAGVLSIAVLGGAALVYSTQEVEDESTAALAELKPYEALRLLMLAEYARVAEKWRLGSNVTIAIGTGLSGSAADVLQRFGHPWEPERSWESNRGVPPPGNVLIRGLRIEGDTGFVAITIGEVAGNPACGYHIDSQYSWRGGWAEPDQSRVVMC
jgi:hypothetical protein